MVSLRITIVVCVLAGCGRFGFEPRRSLDDSGVDDGDSDSTDAPDAAPGSCAGGDGICRVACIGMDPDCTTTCGDGICVGNTGERCSVCSADCATTNPVCGNGACDPSENSDLCYSDCGPTPWPWTADEATLLTEINQLRTAGFDCPGGGGTITAPALTFAPALRPAAREWAWELAHDQISSCNGRTTADRMIAAGATGAYAAWLALGSLTSQDAIAFWLADQTACESIMSTLHTTLSMGVARDAAPNGYVILLD